MSRLVWYARRIRTADLLLRRQRVDVYVVPARTAPPGWTRPKGQGQIFSILHLIVRIAALPDTSQGEVETFRSFNYGGPIPKSAESVLAGACPSIGSSR